MASSLFSSPLSAGKPKRVLMPTGRIARGRGKASLARGSSSDPLVMARILSCALVMAPRERSDATRIQEAKRQASKVLDIGAWSRSIEAD
eukprot:scaffold39129_cov155-Skeletonema_marinoi.AAC.5